MEIEKKKLNLCRDVFREFNTADENESLTIFKEKINEIISTLKSLKSKTQQSTDNKEYYKAISKIYSINLNEFDYLQALSKKNNQEYTHYMTINTDMVYTAVQTDGSGFDFSWWEEKYQVKYEAAVAKGVTIDPNKNYTKKELMELIDSKKITMVCSDSNVLIEDLEKEEDYVSLPVIYESGKNYSLNAMDTDSEIFNFTIERLKNIMNNKVIDKVIPIILQELEQEIQDIFSLAVSSNMYGKIATMCKEWFNSSEEYKDFKTLKKS